MTLNLGELFDTEPRTTKELAAWLRLMADRLESESWHCSVVYDVNRDARFYVARLRRDLLPQLPPLENVVCLGEDETARLRKGYADDLRRIADDVQKPRDKSKAQPSAEMALAAYRLAEDATGHEYEHGLTDDNAYDWLQENGHPDYRLPKRETFKKYLRRARRHHGEQKHKSRKR